MFQLVKSLWSIEELQKANSTGKDDDDDDNANEYTQTRHKSYTTPLGEPTIVTCIRHLMGNSAEPPGTAVTTRQPPASAR